MKKVIELALKSGEITLQGVINLVNCIDEQQQERAVMLLTESYDIPNDVIMYQKGLALNRDGKPHRYYTCVGYNYLRNKVIVKEKYEGNDNEFTTRVTVDDWRKYRQNYIKHQQKEREECVRKQQELQ